MPKVKSSFDIHKPKKARKAINLETKMKVIKQYEVGKKVNVIARDFIRYRVCIGLGYVSRRKSYEKVEKYYTI